MSVEAARRVEGALSTVPDLTGILRAGGKVCLTSDFDCDVVIYSQSCVEAGSPGVGGGGGRGGGGLSGAARLCASPI